MTSIFYALEHINELISPLWRGLFSGVLFLGIVSLCVSLLKFWGTKSEERNLAWVAVPTVVVMILILAFGVVLYWLGGNATAK